MSPLRAAARWLTRLAPASREGSGPRAATPDPARLLAATGQALGAVDGEGRLTFLNPAAARLLGAAPEALLGRHVEGLLLPAREGAAPRTAEACFGAGWGQRRPLEVQPPAVVAEGRDLCLVADPLEEEGRVVGAVLRLEDVGERRQADAALQEAQRALTTLMANLPGMAYRCRNTEGWTMEFASEGCFALTGLPPEALTGPGARDYGALIHPDDRQRVWDEVQAALGAGVPFRTTYRLRTATGEERWVWEQGSGVPGPDGQLLALEGFVTDVTERKRAEERLRVSERMASMGALAAGVAHEINNPLAFVLNNVTYVERLLTAPGATALPAGDVEELHRALQETREGVLRMRDIVRDLRLFSRVDDAGPRWVDLEKVLTSAALLAGGEARERARLVRVTGPAPRVYGPEGRLLQVFVNLLVNAAQALPEGQAERHEIRLRTGTDASGRALVEVSDTGCGIPPEVMPRLFEPFFTTKPVGQGTGLGLSICHGIVSALGGRIEVESEVGRGSTFRVLLPVGGPPASRETPVPPSAPGGRPSRRGRVLVIDDEAPVGHAVRRALEAEHEVEVLTRAEVALERLRSGERYDVILCDLVMPGLDGLAFYEALGTAFPEARARLVFLSGGTPSARANALLTQAGVLLLEKPLGAADLLDVVRARMGGG
jgi:PAS domain S-box-containing protein